MTTAPETLAAAREAGAHYAAEGWQRRRQLLRALRLELAGRLDYYCRAAAAASGKPLAEAALSEIYPCLEILKYYEREGESLLAPRRVKTPFFFSGCDSRSEYRPYGAVLVAGPYNFPFQLTFIPAVTALAAGNAVVIKPSELCPLSGPLLEEVFAAAGAPAGLVQVRCGGPETSRELIEAGPDKVFFTGGAAGGRAVMRLCAERLIPLALELGGKAPMLVFSEADQGRAVAGALYGCFCNAGQVCVSTERIYVQRDRYEAFCAAVAEGAARLRPGLPDGDYGTMVSEAQAAKVLAQVREAVAAGARLLTPERYEEGFLYPLVVAGPGPETRLMTEETFGPVAAVSVFDNEEEAVALANRGPYGLAASVWTSDKERARRVCGRLQAGLITVNDCVRAAGSPYLPFGGVKGSGFGRSHGPEGLYEFCRQASVMASSGAAPSEVNWFPYDSDLYPAMLTALRAFFGPFSARAWRAALGAAGLIKSRTERRGGK
ncbi:MAG: aldehyde dehydrogenase family protein [Elusimicrobiales bacterium]